MALTAPRQALAGPPERGPGGLAATPWLDSAPPQADWLPDWPPEEPEARSTARWSQAEAPVSPLRLRVLRGGGAAPAPWLAACLLALADEPGLVLLPPDSPAQAEVTLALCAPGLQALDTSVHDPWSDDDHPLVQWALVDDRGRALHPQQPLLAALTGRRGIALQLLQRNRPGAPWLPLRRLHRSAPSRWGQALQGLAPAVASLVRQAAIDRRLGLQPAAPNAASAARARAAPPPTLARPLWHRLAGAWRHWVDRQRARWLSEYWSIGLVDAPVADWVRAGGRLPVRWITRPDAQGYHADPMGLPGHDGLLFCEHFDERSGLGRIERLTLSAQGRVTRRERLPLGDGHHLSFPLVVRLQGQTWGLVESAARGDCVLHRVDAQGQWQPHATLLQGKAVADPALFEWEGRFWLACTDVALGASDNLCLFHADRLDGPWQPHANNPVKTDVTGSRMAGGLFTLPAADGGGLIRPAQDCLAGYGSAVTLHRILRCTPTEFVEERLVRIGPDARSPGAHGLHTVSAWNGRTLIDAKRMGVNPVALWRKLAGRLGAPALARAATRAPAPPGRRVCVYIPHLRLGGGETSLLRLADGFARSGLATDLVVHSLDSAELAVPAGVNVIELGAGGSLGAVRRLAAVLRQRQPTWLLSGFPHTNVAAVAAVALSRVACRCIVSEHAPLQLQIRQQANWRYRLLPPLVRWAYRRADAVVAVSGGVRDDLAQLLGHDLQPVVIGNPVLDEAALADADATPLHPWLLDPTLQVVLSVSRLSTEKDLPVLIHAFALLQAQRPNCRLLLAGDGPLREALVERLAALGLSPVAQLPGRVNAPMRWMQHAAVFALASRYEGFGNVLIEALASGTPVVATDCPVGPREVLADGRWGELVPVGDAHGMAAALGRALDQRTPPEGAQAHAGQYTVGRASAAYQRLFDSLVAGPAC